MNVTFYNFTKEENSTKRPSDGTLFDCQIKRGSGLMNPAIELNIGLTQAPEFNYCYIPDFRRFYYVTEWYFDTGFWTASLSCDVLATYRSEIGSADLYALRSAGNWDGRIVDRLYPTKAGCSFNKNAITTIWNDGSYTQGVFKGYYVVGLTSNNGDFGSLRYCLMGETTLKALCNYLTSDTLLSANNITMQDASTELIKNIVDPIQYIKSCIFLPLKSADADRIPTLSDDLYVYDWPINMPGTTDPYLAFYIRPNAPRLTITRTVNIPKHPQTTSRGEYVNLSPYTNLTLHIAPFGIIELDTTVTSNATTLDIEIEVDLPSGLGVLDVKCNGTLLNTVTAQIGVPIQLSQITRDYIGGVTSVMGGLTSTLFNSITGNVGGAIMSAASGVANAVDSLVPRASSVGTGGSYSQLYSEDPYIYAQFFELVDDDIVRNGRPCCKIVNCEDALGYYLIQDGDVPINGTREEAQLVKTYLETGFYYE